MLPRYSAMLVVATIAIAIVLSDAAPIMNKKELHSLHPQDATTELGFELQSLHPQDTTTELGFVAAASATTVEATIDGHHGILDYPRSWLHHCDKESEAYTGAYASVGGSDETDWFGQQPDLVKSVFVRWGHDECPIGSNPLYSGFMAGGDRTHSGSGANYVCLHPDPQEPPWHNDENNGGNLMYGVEFRHRMNKRSDAACVVCQRSGAVSTYVQWGRQTCTNGHQKEYNGNVMAHNSNDKARSEDICVDFAHKAHAASSDALQDWGGSLYTTEMEGGAADESAYPTDSEVGCTVCSVIQRLEGAVYTRWGSTMCPDSASKLYAGFMAGANYEATGSAANYVCMHPDGERAPGGSSGNDGGNLLYGVEYEGQGRRDADAACVVCQKPLARQVYVQWGRQSCSNDHETEYAGHVQAESNEHQKSEYVCVDYQRDGHSRSSSTNDNGGTLYPTQMREGSADERQYPHNSFVGCAVCSVPQSRGFVYPRWGHQTCPAGANELYSGFMASSKYAHSGAGYNDLCMHPQPEAVQQTISSGVTSYLYGMEYRSHERYENKDAACAVCEAPGVAATYVQWGRQQCSSGHHTEYNGFVMGPHYDSNKGESVCIDEARMAHATSNDADNGGGRLYMTEMERGSADEDLYPHNREIGCAVCSSPLVTYTGFGRDGSPGFCTNDGNPYDHSASWTLTGGVDVGERAFESMDYQHWTLRARNECTKECPTCKSVGVTTKAGYACFASDACATDDATDRQTFPIIEAPAVSRRMLGSAALVQKASVTATDDETETETETMVEITTDGEGCPIGTCQATDHVTYLGREAPAMDQWGASHFVASIKPATPTPRSVFTFSDTKVTRAAAAESCVSQGLSLAKLDSAEKARAFKQQWLASNLQQDQIKTTTRFEVLYDATYQGKVYDETRSVDASSDSVIFWVGDASQSIGGVASTCGSVLATQAFTETQTHLSQEHLVDVAGSLLGVDTNHERELMPTACKTLDGVDIEFDYRNLIGDLPPYESSSDALLRPEDASESQATLDAFCYLCHKDAEADPTKCATFGITGGLFAAGASDDPARFNCEELELPYACERIEFETHASEMTEPTCTTGADLHVFPSNEEGARYPTFVKQLTFYYGYLPTIGAHPKAPDSGVRKSYITGVDVVMTEPENLPSDQRLSVYYTRTPLGTRVQADGSPSLSRTCTLEYGDTISGMIEMQSATATWGVGYLKWTSSRGESCEVGFPSADPRYVLGIQHGAFTRNRDQYESEYPMLVYGECHEGYAKVETREDCAGAYDALFNAMQVTGTNKVGEVRTGPGLRGCFVDEDGNGHWQEGEEQCGTGACDAFQPVCSLTDPDMSSGHGRRSMSYVDADGRMLSRVGWYDILRAAPPVPTIDNPYYTPNAVHFGGFAPIFLKKVVRSKFEMPSTVAWIGEPPVPRPQSVASHTYCNEDDTEREFGAYSRAVTQEVGNEFCYSSWTSRTFSLSYEVDFSMCAVGACLAAGGGMEFEDTSTRTQTNCKSTTESTTEAMEFPAITLPARSVVQYTFTRRETTFQDAKITAREFLIFSDGTSEQLGTSEILIQGVARTGTLATFSDVVALRPDETCGYGQSALGAVRTPAGGGAPPAPAPASADVSALASFTPVPKEYAAASFGCAHSALKMSRLLASPHDWGVEQLVLDTRGGARGFSCADQFFGGAAGCPALVGAVPFVASQESRSFVTVITFMSGTVATSKGEQNIITGMIVRFQSGAQEFFGQTSHDGGQAITTSHCSLPMNSLLTGLMHMGTHGKGTDARLGYLKLQTKLPNGDITTCEPVARSNELTVRSFYVERRIISGVLASGRNPMAHVGGFTEFAFTYWKRVSQVKILGAGGADKLDMNGLGEPDVPSPSNEYYHNYCNGDEGPMEFGPVTYDTALEDSSSMCTEDSEESTVGGFGYMGGGFSAEINVCAGFGAMQCSTALEMEFSVQLTVGGSSTSGSSSEECKSETTSTETSLEMPGIELGGHESTEYKVTLFRKKMADVSIQLVKQIHFEDGSTALMPPEDHKLKGVMTTGSMASFHRQVKGLTAGCSYIVEPTIPGKPTAAKRVSATKRAAAKRAPIKLSRTNSTAMPAKPR